MFDVLSKPGLPCVSRASTRSQYLALYISSTPLLQHLQQNYLLLPTEDPSATVRKMAVAGNFITEGSFTITCYHLQ